KRLITSSACCSSNKASGLFLLEGIHSSSSDRRSSATPPPRFFAFFFSKSFKDKFRVILPKKILNLFGRAGGIASHTRKSVSFTHSSASSLLRKIRNAIA